MAKKLFLVETVSIFRQRYVVEAKNAEHAQDEVVIATTGDYDENWKEFSQHHVDECITSTRELTQEKYLKLFDQDNDYLKSWSTEQKLNFINKIDYEENSSNGE